MWKYTSFLFLFGCPVEPTDVQDIQEQQLPQQGNNMPPANGGQKPNGQGNAQGQAGQNQGQNMGQNQGQNQGNLEGGMINDPNSSGMPSNMVQNGDGAPPIDASAGQDVLPIYEDPPSFDQLIEAGNAIAINLTVKGADNYNIEFVIAQEGSGRTAPKVVHLQKSTEETVSIQAPMDFPNKVWLIITADVGSDGPTKDDLFAGTKEPITLGSEDITLEYTLVNDDSWMESLPWFSRVENPATKKSGEPTDTEGN